MRAHRAIVVLCVVGLLASCARQPAASWLRHRGDENGSYRVVLELPRHLLPSADPEAPWPQAARADIALPAHSPPAYGDARQTGTALFVGDVRGGPESEIVLHSQRRLSVLAEGGRPHFTTEYEDYRRLPFGLHDLDKDGKLDILSGSLHAARPTIRAVSGSGVDVFRYSINPALRGYSSLFVGSIGPEHMLLINRELWPTDARGATAIDPAGQELLWTFFVPASPLGVATQWDADGSPVYTFSQVARYNGMFLGVGDGSRSIFGADASMFLIRAAADGSLLLAELLDFEDVAAPRISRFQPFGPAAQDDLLAAVDIEYRTRPDAGASEVFVEQQPSWLYRVGVDGEVTAARRFEPFELVDFRIRTGTPGGLFLLLQSNGLWRLETTDRDFRPLAVRDLRGPAALGAVVESPENQDDGTDELTFDSLLFVQEGDVMLLYDTELSRRVVYEGLPEVSVSMAWGPSDAAATMVPIAAFNRRQSLETSVTAAATPLQMTVGRHGDHLHLLVFYDEKLVELELRLR